MKVIVPLAGKGTRLLPLTKHVPKPLVRVAGRPVMDYVMDAVKPLDVEEIIVITGHLKDVVEQYIVTHYDVPAKFVEQKTLDGTAGAINLARPFVDGPVLIIFVDTLFEADLSIVRTADADGIIWVKEVEDYQRFGVIVTDARGYMRRIVEKPSTPVSRLANIGLQYVKDWKTLFEGIAHVLRRPPGKGGGGCSRPRCAAGTTAVRWTRCSRRTAICSSRAGPGSRRDRAPAARSCRRSTSRTASRSTTRRWDRTCRSRRGATSPKARSRTRSWAGTFAWSGARCVARSWGTTR